MSLLVVLTSPASTLSSRSSLPKTQKLTSIDQAELQERAEVALVSRSTRSNKKCSSVRSRVKLEFSSKRLELPSLLTSSKPLSGTHLSCSKMSRTKCFLYLRTQPTNLSEPKMVTQSEHFRRLLLSCQDITRKCFKIVVY